MQRRESIFLVSYGCNGRSQLVYCDRRENVSELLAAFAKTGVLLESWLVREVTRAEPTPLAARGGET